MVKYLIDKIGKFRLNPILAVVVVLTIASQVPVIYRAHVNSQDLPKISVDFKSAIKVDGPISDLSDQVKKFRSIVRSGASEVKILINSPGGIQEDGMELVEEIWNAQYLGVNVVCIVDGMAASMAVIILSECDKRYAVYGSTIMWHSAAQFIMFSSLNERDAASLADRLQVINDTIWKSTRIFFWPWYFIKHYEDESFIPVTDIERNGFGYLRVLRNIEVINEKGVKAKVKK